MSFPMAQDRRKKVILTTGFVKKTQKTPPREIEKAKRYRADHQQREES